MEDEGLYKKEKKEGRNVAGGLNRMGSTHCVSSVSRYPRYT